MIYFFEDKNKMSSKKYENCVLKVKKSGRDVNAFAVCHYLKSPTAYKVKLEGGGSRRIYEGARGGKYYIVDGKKIYLHESVGKAVRSPQRRQPIEITKRHSLTDLGYRALDPTRTRHVALERAVGKYGFASVVRKLNALEILNKNKQPKLSGVYGKDKVWVEKHF